MAKVQRFYKNGDGSLAPQYSIGLNIILTGSKEMSEDEQDHAMANEPDFVEVIIRDADNPERILVTERVSPKAFSTGSVGYGLHVRKAAFLTP